MENRTALFDKTIDLYKRHAGEVAMRRLPSFIEDLYGEYRAGGWEEWDDSKYIDYLPK